MNIYINGEATHVQASTVAELIHELNLQDKRIAVELNEQLIAKSRHAETMLTDDVKIEIIQAVGGG